MQNEVKLLKRKEVLARLGVCDSTLRRLVAKGEFPPPLKISQRRMAWRSDAIDQHIEALGQSNEESTS
jgi:predicted DNA-binding transcriptional regulator AlpA